MGESGRGTDGRLYPWGNDWDLSKCDSVNNKADLPYFDQPVGSYPAGASPYGALDMMGSTGEWCADWYDEQYYQFAPTRNPAGPPPGSVKVIRGGVATPAPPSSGSAFRGYMAPYTRPYGVGFRCRASSSVSAQSALWGDPAFRDP